MPLTLKRNDQLEANDRFRVLSGKAVVGTLMRVPSGEKQGWWHWSITGFHVSPTDLGPGAGRASQRSARACGCPNKRTMAIGCAGPTQLFRRLQSPKSPERRE